MYGLSKASVRLQLTGAALGVLFGAIPVGAQTDGDRLRALEDRITALEDELQASRTLIRAQEEALQDRGLPAVGQQGSGFDSFLETVEIGGHVAASYIYNFNQPETNAATNSFCQFNCNHNEFSLDLAKLEIGRSASEAGSAGFQFDIGFGQNATIMSALAAPPDVDSTVAASNASDQELFIQQAYASFNTGGMELKLGKFETLLGYEVLDSDANPNVTQGLLFTWAIPLYHTGLLASGDLGGGLGWAAGIVNGFNNTRDQGDNKGALAQLSWAGDLFSITASSFVGTLGETRTRLGNGAVVGDDGTITKIFDGILEIAPSEAWKIWLNADWGHTQVNGVHNDPHWFGASLGYQQYITRSFYFALRGEYFNDDGGSRFGGIGGVTGTDEIDAISATLTLGYQLTPNLLGRLELRRDMIDCDAADCAIFFDSRGRLRKDVNDIGLVELVYSFD